MPRFNSCETPLAYFAINHSIRLDPPWPPDICEPVTAAPLEPTRTLLPGFRGRLRAACSQNRPALTSASQATEKSSQLNWSSRPILGVAPALSAKLSG